MYKAGRVKMAPATITPELAPMDWEYRRSKGIIRITRTVGVKSYHVKDGPGRHGTGIIITGNTIGSIFKILLQKPLSLFLRTPFFALEIRKEMSIGNVGFIGRIIETIVKDTLKFFNERFLSTHETGKPFHIVGNIETVIPSTSFMKTGIRFKIAIWLPQSRILSWGRVRCVKQLEYVNAIVAIQTSKLPVADY